MMLVVRKHFECSVEEHLSNAKFLILTLITAPD